LPIAQAAFHDLGGAQQERALERRIAGELGLGLDRPGEPLRVAGALRVALEGEDRAPPLGRELEDLVERLERARGLAELVFPDGRELLVEAYRALGIGGGLGGLRIELDPRPHAPAVGLGVARPPKVKAAALLRAADIAERNLRRCRRRGAGPR